jgi:uncharacterized membrane protein
MHLADQKRFTRRSIAPIRLLCYVLGPFSFALILAFRRYGHAFAVRFHAFHAMLMSGVWAGIYGGLRLVEHTSPWFLGMVAKHVRFAMNLWFMLLWVFLLVTAYTGSRFVVIPFIHRLAIRLARKPAASA